MNAVKDIVTLENVSIKYKTRHGIFRYEEFLALSNINLTISKGERLAILGLNGSGKSTLLKVINKLIRPTNGTVEWNQDLKVALLTLGLGFNRHLSGKDNAIINLMINGHSKSESTNLLKEIHEFSELGNFFDKPIKTYSSGMTSRLGFAVAIHANLDLILVDETLTVGDHKFREKALRKTEEILTNDKSLVFVSHSIKQINDFCKEAILLQDGQISKRGTSRDITSYYLETLVG